MPNGRLRFQFPELELSPIQQSLQELGGAEAPPESDLTAILESIFGTSETQLTGFGTPMTVPALARTPRLMQALAGKGLVRVRTALQKVLAKVRPGTAESRAASELLGELGTAKEASELFKLVVEDLPLEPGGVITIPREVSEAVRTSRNRRLIKLLQEGGEEGVVSRDLIGDPRIRQALEQEVTRGEASLARGVSRTALAADHPGLVAQLDEMVRLERAGQEGAADRIATQLADSADQFPPEVRNFLEDRLEASQEAETGGFLAEFFPEFGPQGTRRRR